MKAKKTISILLMLTLLLSCLPMQTMAEEVMGAYPDALDNTPKEDVPVGTPDNLGQDDEPLKPDDYEEPTNTTRGTCGENLTWALDENGTLTISGTGEMDGWALADEPWHNYKDSITAVVIEDGVTSIGTPAFWGCDRITSVVIPASVTVLDYYSFAYCDKLAAILFEGDAPDISEGAFYGVTATIFRPAENTTWAGAFVPSHIETLTLATYTDFAILEQPQNVPIVPDGTVEFSVVTYGDGLTYQWWVAAPGTDSFIQAEATGSTYTVAVDRNSIGLRVYCVVTDSKGNSIHSEVATVTDLPVIYEEGYTYIDIDEAGERVYYSFTPNYSCEYNFKCSGSGYPHYYLYDFNMNLLSEGFCDSYYLSFNEQLQSGKTYIFAVHYEDETEIGMVSVSVRIRHDYAYEIIKDATCTIDGQGKYTCSGCSYSYTESIPASHQTENGMCSVCGLQPCGDNVVWSFDEATGTLTLSGTGAVANSGYGGMPWYEYTDKIRSVVVEHGVTGLGYYAFSGCINLTDVVLPSSLTEIANGAFSGTGLARIEIPDGVTTIGSAAFSNCKALKEICFSDSVTTIDAHAFAENDSLETIVIPASIIELGGNAFYYCTNLRRIDFLGSFPRFGYNVFGGVTADAYYPAGDASWTPEMMEYLGGNLTWYDSNGALALFRLSGANIALGNSLAMNFFIDKSYLSGSDYYAVITHYDHDDLGDVFHVYTIPFTQWEERQDYMVVTLENLAAKNMIDYIEVQVFRADGTPCTAVWGDSMQDYAMRIFDKQDDVTKTLLVDMLNYGAAAQTYFGYRDTYLVNECLTEEQQAYATQSVTCTDQRVKGENYFGSTLVLENRIQLTMYFQDISTDMYAVVSYTDHNGNAVNYTVSGTDFAQFNANTYGVTVETLAVADGDQLVTVTVYDKAGNAVAGASDTVNGYLSRMMGPGELVDDIFEAVAKFTNAAYAYFH
jgi:hypothetical protein